MKFEAFTMGDIGQEAILMIDEATGKVLARARYNGESYRARIYTTPADPEVAKLTWGPNDTAFMSMTLRRVNLERVKEILQSVSVIVLNR